MTVPRTGRRTGAVAPRVHHAPRIRLGRRQLIVSGLFVLGVIAFLYLGLPKLVGLGATLRRLREGNVWWLAAALALEVGSYLGYAALFRAVFRPHGRRLGWRASTEVALASTAATRLFAAGGAGGVALTAWALARAGMEPREVASRMVSFLVLLYAVYMGTLLVDGLGLYLHLFPGTAPFAITVVPAIFGAVVIALVLAISAIPAGFERMVSRWTQGGGRLGRLARSSATVPAAAATGTRGAFALLRSRDPGLVGALVNWGMDIGCLWAAFHAFGYAPPVAVVVMAYFVGWLANLLPLPGGVGGVEGGLIGALSALGVPVDGAVVAVLAYRGFSFWLPTPVGGLAYLSLRRTVRGWDGAGPSVDPGTL